jgi:hypothetical protein
MILYYALGGGLGHLTRGRRVLETLGLTRDVAFVTASPHATDVRVTGGIPAIAVPASLETDREAHRAWLPEITRNADRLIVDVFPCGIQGELHGLELPMDLVARRLRWSEYRRVNAGPLPRFDTIWCVEALEPEQERELRALGARVETLTLRATETIPIAMNDSYWLIVHSGPEDEVHELVDYTSELMRLAETTPSRVLVATRCAIALPMGFECVDAVPVEHLFAGAGRIISAAGFNVMLETEPWREKHSVLPFARAFDDQYYRATSSRLG